MSEPDVRTRAAKTLLVLVALGTILLSSCRRSPVPHAGSEPGGTRVVALSPAIAATLRDVGLGTLIVGRHAYDEFTDPAIAVCGDQAGIDDESLLRVAPTHVFIQMKTTPPHLLELGGARGFMVENFQILSLDDIRLAARRMWNWHGAPGPVPERNLQRAPLEDRMDAAWSRQPGISAARVGRVLLLTSVDPPSVPGPGSFHDDILKRIGATPAITDGAPYITLDNESVLRLAPDAIILLLPRPAGAPPAAPPTPADLRAMLGTLGTLDIPALRNGRVALIDDPMCHIPGTNMIGLAEEIARVLENWSR